MMIRHELDFLKFYSQELDIFGSDYLSPSESGCSFSDSIVSQDSSDGVREMFFRPRSAAFHRDPASRSSNLYTKFF